MNAIKVGPYMSAHAITDDTYTVHDKHDHILGTVEWYPRWRTFVFSPERDAMLSADCLRELARFLENCAKAKEICAGGRR